MRALILALYLHAWRTVPEARELTGRYSLTYSITLALWLLSLAVPAPGRYWLWGTAQLAEIANGPVTHATIRQVPQRVSHMDERLGLFVIIVLGEAVVQVATGLADAEWRWQGTLTGVCGFLCAVWAWWIYFVRADPSILTRALRSDRRSLLLAFAYAYSHFFVFAGITAAAVGIQEAIRTSPTEALPAGAALALGCGAAAFLLGVTALQWAAPHSLPRAVVRARLAAAALAALLAAGGPVLGAMGSVVVLAATLAVLVTVETVYCVRYDVRYYAALRPADLQPERD